MPWASVPLAEPVCPTIPGQQRFQKGIKEQKKHNFPFVARIAPVVGEGEVVIGIVVAVVVVEVVEVADLSVALRIE